MTKIDRQATYTGTKEVSAPLRFDTARLEAYLTANAKGFAGPLSVKQFRGGQSNPTYLLETPARKYVLRRKPPGKRWRRSEIARRSLVASRRARSALMFCAEPHIGHRASRQIWARYSSQTAIDGASRRALSVAVERSVSGVYVM